MPSLHQFRLPDIGEGLTEADILRWDVAVGDTVTVNQTLAEVETAKAAVELPSPYAGVVQALHVEAGQTVEVGTPIITIDTGEVEEAVLGEQSLAGSDEQVVSGERADVAPAAGGPAIGEPGVHGGVTPPREPVLVGYGPGQRGSRRRVPSAQAAFDRPAGTTREASPATSTPPAPNPPAPAAPPLAPAAPSTAPSPVAVEPDGNGTVTVLAKPPVRLLARTLGVDLATVIASGPHGTVTRADVEAAASGGASGPAGAEPAASRSNAGTPGAREDRFPVRGVRKHTAAAMVASAFTAPHVTEFVTVDVTETLALRDRVAARPEFRDVKLSPLTFVARALLLAIPRTPSSNATWEQDAAGQATIVHKHYVNLGIAAATDRGLVVPNIRDAHAMSLQELAVALGELTATARAGRTTPAALSGGTITITNIGVFGIDAGTPILNPGESAILAVGAIKRMPWVVVRDGVEVLEPRSVMQLALSFDHRLIDGAEGSRFLADIAAVLQDPGLALL